MYCHCCQTRILKDEINANGGQCPECGTVPQWHSKLWEEEPQDVLEDDDQIQETGKTVKTDQHQN